MEVERHNSGARCCSAPWCGEVHEPRPLMRLWSLHPRYLDAQGLVALWREALLARAVLSGATRGYRHHPQLERFRSLQAPCAALSSYLMGIHAEAMARGYAFDRARIGEAQTHTSIAVTAGQLEYEWRHLLRKLALRSPALHERWRAVDTPEYHPIFRLQPGPVEPWERAIGEPPATHGRV